MRTFIRIVTVAALAAALTSCGSTNTVTPSSTGPNVAFDLSPSDVIVGRTIFFNAIASKPAPGKAIASYAWDFGDGSTATGVNPTHKWTATGKYKVYLTETDNVGAQQTASKDVAVGTGAPVASFAVATPSPYTSGTPITFNASASTAILGATIVDYTWTVVDPNGSVSTFDTFASPTLVFSGFVGKGSATIQLQVTDDSARKATTSQTLTIQ